MEQRLSTLLQQKWLAKLMGLDYEIVYKKGVDNGVADALSRLPDTHQGELAAISSLQPEWIKEIIDSYVNDPETNKILQGILAKEAAYQHYNCNKGLLKVGDIIYIGTNGNCRNKLIWELHDGPAGGHSGQEVTLKKVSQFFYWPAMKEEVVEYVRSRDLCQRVKTSNHFPYGLLQPLPIPDQILKDISMDFIEGLPKSRDKNCILVIIDRLTKSGHLIAISHLFTATSIAQLFLDNVYKLHGMPNTIVLDRDKLFTS